MSSDHIVFEYQSKSLKKRQERSIAKSIEKNIRSDAVKHLESGLENHLLWVYSIQVWIIDKKLFIRFDPQLDSTQKRRPKSCYNKLAKLKKFIKLSNMNLRYKGHKSMIFSDTNIRTVNIYTYKSRKLSHKRGLVNGFDSSRPQIGLVVRFYKNSEDEIRTEFDSQDYDDSDEKSEPEAEAEAEPIATKIKIILPRPMTNDFGCVYNPVSGRYIQAHTALGKVLKYFYKQQI